MIYHLASIPRGMLYGITIIEYQFFGELVLPGGEIDHVLKYSKFALVFEGAWFDVEWFDSIESARTARNKYWQQSMTADAALRAGWKERHEVLDHNGSPIAEINRILAKADEEQRKAYIDQAQRLVETTDTHQLPPQPKVS